MNDPPPLIESLQNPDLYPHEVDSFDLIETHISWVILTGAYAYKIKKSVEFDFVDFSTLERRRRFCQKELQLNRRLSPDLYEAVVPITGPDTEPSLDDPSDPIEYAIRMKEFNQENLFSNRVMQDRLEPDTVDELAERISQFHTSIDDNPPDEHYGSPDLIETNMVENFEAINPSYLDDEAADKLRWVQEWSKDRFEELKPLMKVRRRNGSVRNCHGDMHLRNIVSFQGEINIFDCIEFNDSFRWIDVLDEVAFLTMDFVDRGHPDLARRLVDRYLTHSNQYDGLPLLNFYRTYRAMVRCKVCYLQDDPENSDSCLSESFGEYLETARFFTDSPAPVLLITHGVSGTGKSTVSQTILEEIGAIRLRSDIERKRIAGIPYTRNASHEPDRDLYTEEMTERTYEVLRSKAETVLKAGFPVIVDATFLKKRFRDLFDGLAERLEVPFRIVHVNCEEEVLRNRLRERKHEKESVSDAGTGVLDHQLEIRDELKSHELTSRIEVKTDKDGLTEDKLAAIKSLV